MSSQIKPILVKSDVLAGLSDSVYFAVKKGAKNNSTVKYTPTSSSPSSQAYTATSPSLSVVMGREVLWHVEKQYTITGYPTVGTYLVKTGYDAPAPFTNHADVINTQILINSTSVSMTTQQQLDALLHNCDKEKLAKWSAFAPAMLDPYANYADMTTSTINSTFADSLLNNPLAGFERAYLGEVLPRGCYIKSIAGNDVGTWTPAVAEGALVPPVAGDLRTVIVTVASTEPVMCAPFTWGDEENQAQGMYGISTCQFTFNLDPTGRRGFRWANNPNWLNVPAGADEGSVLTAVNKRVTNLQYVEGNCYLEIRYFTPHPSDLLPEVNVVACPTYEIHRSQPTNTVVPFSPTGAPASATLITNNFQLNSIPDKVFIWIKPIDSQLTNNYADACCAIRNVSISFANQSNLLASMSQEQLWRLSRNAGSNQSWVEFRGLSLADTPNSAGSTVSTKGSILVLDFEDIGISEDFYAPGSVGMFNFSAEVQYSNTTGFDIQPEINVMFMRAGVFVNQNGTSALYSSGLLSKQQTLDASIQEPIVKSQLKRMVGGSFLSNLSSIASKALPFVKQGLSMVQHPVAQTASKAIGSLGYGETGAGRMKHRLL